MTLKLCEKPHLRVLQVPGGLVTAFSLLFDAAYKSLKHCKVTSLKNVGANQPLVQPGRRHGQ